MYEIDQASYVIDGCAWQDAMTQIENVAGPPGSLIKDQLSTFLQFGPGRKECDGIEIALDRYRIAKLLPGLRQIDVPVDADHIAARLLYQVKHAAGISAKVNNGNIALTRNLYRAATIWQDVLAVVGGAQSTNPAIEELQSLCARLRLGQ